MKYYFIASLLFKDKYKALAFYDATDSILVVTELAKIDKRGVFDRDALIKEIKALRQGGVQTLVETRDKSFLKYTPIITLSDRNEDARPYQDVYFEHMETMYQSQQIDIGEDKKSSFDHFFRKVKKTYDSRTGRIVYDFIDAEKNELRPVMLLVALHVDPPRGVGFALGIEQAMGGQPKEKTAVERMKYAVGIGFDEKTDAYWENKIAETQKHFK